MSHLLWLQALWVAAWRSVVTSQSMGRGIPGYPPGNWQRAGCGRWVSGTAEPPDARPGLPPGSRHLGAPSPLSSLCQPLPSDLPGRRGSEQHQPSLQSPGASLPRWIFNDSLHNEEMLLGGGRDPHVQGGGQHGGWAHPAGAQGTRLPSVSQLQAAGLFLRSHQAAICRFRSAPSEEATKPQHSRLQQDPKSGEGMTQPPHSSRGAWARGSPPSLRLFKELNPSEGLKQCSLLKYCPSLSSDRACKHLPPAPGAPGCAQSPPPCTAARGTERAFSHSHQHLHRKPSVHRCKSAELTSLRPSGPGWWGFSPV